MSDRAYFDVFAQALLSREPVKDVPVFIGEPSRVEAGLAVYRNNIRSALSKALAAKFPVVEKLVGEEFFKFLAHEYFHAHPPASQLIMNYGDALPAFLENFEPASSAPYLADIARLEIAWLESYHAPDAAPLAPEALTAAIGDSPTQLRFDLHPSLRLVASQWPVASIWRHNKAHETPPPATFDGAESVLIVRPARDVVVSAIAPGVFVAIRALSESARLEDALSKGMAVDATLDPKAVFQTLFEHRAIIAAGE